MEYSNIIKFVELIWVPGKNGQKGKASDLSMRLVWYVISCHYCCYSLPSVHHTGLCPGQEYTGKVYIVSWIIISVFNSFYINV